MKTEDEAQKKSVSFAIAYWKKRWVWVPYLHLPEDSPSNYNLEKIRPFLPENYDPQQGIEEEDLAFETIHPRESIISWLWDQKDLEELCKINDIPIGWVIGRQFKKPATQNAAPNRRIDRKVPSLKGREIQKILTEAKKLNKKHAIVLQILWHVNKGLSNTGTFVTLEEILRMQIRSISSYNEQACNSISLYRETPFGGHLVGFSLPRYLWKATRDQISTKTLFIFSNKYGGPFNPLQIDKTLKPAARIAGIPGLITSLSLRPPFEKKRIERIAKRNRYNGPTNDHLKDVTIEEWNVLCNLFPELQPTVGRKPRYTPLEMLNAILYQLRTHCPIRKLPDSFPDWRAIESQKRRWEERGIFQKILAHRSS